MRNSSGIGFCGLLTIAFIVLQLCEIIHWSWLWVLSPLWLPLATILATLAILATIVGAKDFCQHYRKQNSIKIVY